MILTSSTVEKEQLGHKLDSSVGRQYLARENEQEILYPACWTNFFAQLIATKLRQPKGGGSHKGATQARDSIEIGIGIPLSASVKLFKHRYETYEYSTRIYTNFSSEVKLDLPLYLF